MDANLREQNLTQRRKGDREWIRLRKAYGATGRRFTQMRTTEKMNRKSARTLVTFVIFCE
jgi:hypothetical protein